MAPRHATKPRRADDGLETLRRRPSARPLFHARQHDVTSNFCLVAARMFVLIARTRTMPAFGTFETCRPTLMMSVHRGRPEVAGRLPKRRFDPTRALEPDQFPPPVRAHFPLETAIVRDCARPAL